jgi:hypothetical protein
MQWLLWILATLALCVASLWGWRRADSRTERHVRDELLRHAGPPGPAFALSMIEDLPEPARRYFCYTIEPGTPLVSVVELEMSGQLGLGDKDEPGYRPMRASQTLAPPAGFVWQARTGPISGSDGATGTISWTRFWLLGLIPVVRVSGNPDHLRSAFGRIVVEGAFWVPSSLLPGNRVSWEAVDENTARATVTSGRFSQALDLTMDSEGRPNRVEIQRWSNVNAEKEFRLQPFGGYLSDFKRIGGYHVPMRVEGGNLIGTEDYFPFFRASIESVRFPQLRLDSGRAGAN